MYNSFKNLKKKRNVLWHCPIGSGTFSSALVPIETYIQFAIFQMASWPYLQVFLSYSLKYWIRHTQFTAIQPCSSILQPCAFAFQDIVSPSIRNDLLLISDSPVLCPWGSYHIVPSVLCQPVSPLSSQFLHNSGHALWWPLEHDG